MHLFTLFPFFFYAFVEALLKPFQTYFFIIISFSLCILTGITFRNFFTKWLKTPFLISKERVHVLALSKCFQLCELKVYESNNF